MQYPRLFRRIKTPLEPIQYRNTVAIIFSISELPLINDLTTQLAHSHRRHMKILPPVQLITTTRQHGTATHRQFFRKHEFWYNV
jgi:hypothetical protein